MTTKLASNYLLCGLQTVVLREDRTAAGNSTYPKGGVSCSKDSFVGSRKTLCVMLWRQCGLETVELNLDFYDKQMSYNKT